MIPQQIDPDGVWGFEDLCAFASKWGISALLAQRLMKMRSLFPVGLAIRSGYRTAEEQAALGAAGRPAARDDLSTHRSCPATGADLDVIGASPLDPGVKAAFGVAAVHAGLRWGGGSPMVDGIPTDWNHVDLGPRNQ